MQEYDVGHVKVVFSTYKSQQDSDIETAAKSEAVRRICSQLHSKTILVLGGDGSMLEAISKYYPEYVYYCGVNFGTKGFLLHEKSVLEEKEISFVEKKYPLITCKIGSKTFYAFNEFDIKSSDGKMLDLGLRVSDHQLDILGDGILVSSAAGSTGYNASLGGPILSHDMYSYIITPKAAWRPRGQLPILLSGYQKLSIMSQGRNAQIELYSDGQKVEKYSEHIHAEVHLQNDQIHFLISQSYIHSWESLNLKEQNFTKTS